MLESGTASESQGDGHGESTVASTAQPVVRWCTGAGGAGGAAAHGGGPGFTECEEQVDPTATITVRTYRCPWSATSQAPQVACSVESGYLLVGGGVETEAESPGALVVGSYPTSNPMVGSQVGETWQGSTKDHIVAYPHRSRAYAIGLKLAGVSKESLLAQSFLGTAQSSPTPTAWPTVTAVDSRPGDIVVGGGGYGVPSIGAGQLLTATRPDGTNGWTTASKDHGVSDPGKSSPLSSAFLAAQRDTLAAASSSALRNTWIQACRPATIRASSKQSRRA